MSEAGFKSFLDSLRELLPDYPDGAPDMPPWVPYSVHMADAIRRCEAHDALLKAAKEAAPWLEELMATVDSEWDFPGCKWSTEKLKAQQALDNLRAAVALAEGQPKEREGGSQ